MKLTDTIVKCLQAPASGNRITYDTDLKGFGVRVTAKGARAFILNYRTRTGRERRFTIGSFPDWKTGAARVEASDLKKRIDVGEDPMAAVEADRDAKTVGELCDRFEQDHLLRKRPSTQRDYLGVINRYIRPDLKHIKVAALTYADLDGLHRKVSRQSTHQANRTLAVMSKMLSHAIRWGWRTDNPARGVERSPDVKRQRYLTGEELARLTVALAEHDDQQAANIVRLLLLTGARRGEVLSAKWVDLDLQAGVWTKPGASTKQKREHRVPLSGPARQLLRDLWENAAFEAEFVFPGRHGRGHRVEVKYDWAALCKASGIAGARVHDLRHTFASVLASSGLSLPLIGGLLGHSNPSTTHRYAHLFDDPLRAATETAGAIVMPSVPAGEVVPIKGPR